MSIQSFKPEIMEQALILEFHNKSILDKITTAPSSTNGAKAIFNRIGGGSVKAYAGIVDYDDITSTPVEMLFDKQNYFAIQLDDVDAVQAKAETMQPVVEDLALQVAEQVETQVLADVVDNVTPDMKITKDAMLPSDAYDLVVDLGIKLGQKKVPVANRVVVCNNEFLQQMAKDDRFARNFTILEDGLVDGANINGMKIVVSENAPAGKVIALHKSAVGFATQINKVEALRLEGAFADAIRGLNVHGNVVLRPEAIAVLEYELA